jgi:hypothetical protein
MPEGLRKKAKYGVLINLEDYIQIPLLKNISINTLNENPYIYMGDIHEEYESLKGMAGEKDFWDRVKFTFEQGKVGGYVDEAVYLISETEAIVLVDKKFANLYFWDPDVRLEDDEEEWLWDNAEEHELYLDGNPTTYLIYTVDIKVING